MTVFCLKLVTGEEIIGEMSRKGGVIAVSHPMNMDYSEGDGGGRHVYMGRYNPYNKDRTIYVDRRHVVWMRPVLEEVVQYYQATLKVSNEILDVNFKKSMKLAAQRGFSDDETEQSGEVELSSGSTVH